MFLCCYLFFFFFFPRSDSSIYIWNDYPSTEANANDTDLFDSSLNMQLNHSDLEQETEFGCEITLTGRVDRNCIQSSSFLSLCLRIFFSGTEINFTESARYLKVNEEPTLAEEVEEEVEEIIEEISNQVNHGKFGCSLISLISFPRE